MKKVLIAILMLLVVVGVGFALYYIVLGGPGAAPATNAPGTAATNTGAGLPTAGAGTPQTGATGATALPATQQPTQVANGGLTVVRPVSPAPTVGASISTSGQVSYYDRNDGRFYRMNADGTVSQLSDKQFFDVSNATFDPSGNKAILEYPDGSNIYYNFATGEQVTLPSHWQDFSFTAQGNQIIAKSMGIDPEARYLVMANPDGSQARPIQALGDNADKVTVAPSPDAQIVATSATGDPLGPDRQQIYFIGQNHENFKSFTVEGLNFQPKWNPNGEQLLYSVAGSISNYKPMLWVMDASGDNIGRNRKSINVNTWANKCTFADPKTLYCAVPQSLPDGAGLQPAVADQTPDDIYKIDITTGLKTLVAVPEGQHTVDKIMVSPSGQDLYFTDKGTGLLNKVQIKP